MIFDLRIRASTVRRNERLKVNDRSLEIEDIFFLSFFSKDYHHHIFILRAKVSRAHGDDEDP